VALLGDDTALRRGGGEPLVCPDHARAAAIAGLARPDRTLLVAMPTSTGARMLHEDLANFLGRDAVLFPAWETLPFERVSPGVETMGRRAEVLWRLSSDERPLVVVGSARSLLQRLAPRASVLAPIEVRRGGEFDPEELLRRLVDAGYRRETMVEHRGEVARRGSIVDVFPSTADAPLRIDLWGDEVDRLGSFDVADQRTTEELEFVRIFSAREFHIDEHVRNRAEELVREEPWGREHWERLAHGAPFDGMESWMPWFATEDRLLPDLLAADEREFEVLLVEPSRFRSRATAILAEEDDLAVALASTWSRPEGATFPRLHVEHDRLFSALADTTLTTMLGPAESTSSRSLTATRWGGAASDLEATTARLANLAAEGWTVVLCAEREGARARFVEFCGEYGLTVAPDLVDATAGVHAVVAPLHQGCLLPGSRVAIITEADLTGRRSSRRAGPSARRGGPSIFEDLKTGDFVVHEVHGVGVYEGMTRRAIGGVERDYLLLSYKGGDRLYVPVDQIGTVRQYIGGETPTLHRLGGADFARSKQRVRSAVREIAQNLVLLYQQRVNSRGHAFSPDTPWQAEMESAFPWIETADQMRAILDVKADMERDVPMDRLVCGDVGFGKTEVAVRAAFKCIQDGRQVAVLVPTTLLAAQHSTTFSERFAAFPIRVEVLSRFVSQANARRVLAGLRDGTVDCVIGTHRLLQEGVEFKNLGLLVVDEEQRFGVQHKEMMKRLRADVDVLTLSATPIPRTLEMSLVGIRDLSLLQTPPADRLPVLTFVGDFDERVAVEAIRRELLREGQVFWVHNRVQSIDDRAADLRRLVPEARIAVAHGQMDETTLERTVVDFWEGKFDVLVCTTIIESGIDMPSVNTLVVERAELLGLGQLHQIRGRVGRSGSRAYAYLFHPAGRALGAEAYERLRTIGETTDLGSGFKIAMRDLEIRGAGNLLGEAQSGYIAAVGYDLYCQLVTEAVAEMKGEDPPAVDALRLDLPADAFLPDDYVSREESRLEAYRRLATVESDAQVDDVRTEWLDRYGPIPAPAEELLTVARLRAACITRGITEVAVTDGRARLTPVVLSASLTMRLARVAAGATWDERTRTLVAPLPKDRSAPGHLLSLLVELFDN